MALEVELTLFESKKLGWLPDHEGEFVLIKGDEFTFYVTADDAYQAGVEKYGNVDVFIKRVLAKDQVEDSLSLLYGLVHVG